MALKRFKSIEYDVRRSLPSDAPRHVFFGQCYGIFCDDSLSCGGVGCNEDGISHFKMINSLLLESVQLEGVLELQHKSRKAF